jgi:hypothetical protein
LEAQLGKKCIVCGDEDLWQRGRGGPVQRVWDLSEGAFWGQHVFGLAASAGDAHDAPARFQAQGHGADGYYFAREFEAGDVGGRTGRRGVVAASLENIGAVEARSVDADEYLVTAGQSGIRQLAYRENLWSTCLGDYNCAHANRIASRRAGVYSKTFV